MFFAPGAPRFDILGLNTTTHDIHYTGFSLLFVTLCATTGIFTGMHFSIVSIRSENKLVQWKGRFLLISFIMFGIGALCDILLPVALFYYLIIRIILIISTSLFYIGFIMPKWMQRLLSLSND